jgi:hypothetical protein
VVFERFAEIESKIAYLFNQFLVKIQDKIVFVAHLRLHSGGCGGTFFVISLAFVCGLKFYP